MERREGGVALAGRRLLAAGIDGLAALLLAVLLAPATGRWFAARAAVALRIGEPGTVWTGGWPLALGAVGDLVYGLPLTLTLILLAEPLTGWTPGRARLGLALRSGSRWTRFAVKGVGGWGLALALAAGSWPWTVAAAAATAVALLGAAPLLLGRRPLHDVLAGAETVRAR